MDTHLKVDIPFIRSCITYLDFQQGKTHPLDPLGWNRTPSCKYGSGGYPRSKTHRDQRITPKTAAELRPQFEALCHALGFDPKLPDILDILRDPRRVPPEVLMYVIETDAVGAYNGTFRGCLDGSWMATDPDPMTWQRSGEFGRKLREKGVKSVVVGHVSEEWYLCSISNPINSPADIVPNLLRYYPQSVVDALISMHPTLPDTATPEESQRLFGDILGDGQVHIPTRLLARDLQLVDFPVLRYEIRWTPEQLRPKGRRRPFCFLQSRSD